LENTEISSIGAWEAAYRRFETPEEEIAKFVKRLDALGARDWPQDARIVEIFCGRGNGLKALERLGFTNLEGIDLSADLLADYTGSAQTIVADCRRLRLDSASRDVIIVQGGLHHLPALPDDLDRVLSEVRRVLKPDGRFIAVEPWLTPFLRFVHAVASNRWARRVWPKVDALQTMIEHERETYEQWLSRPQQIQSLLQAQFRTERMCIARGKLMFVGRPKGGTRGG
jgi:SAM-dependent methyltransferase